MITIVRSWWKRRRAQQRCFHHDRHATGTDQAASWISSRLVDLGRRKIFWCIRCHKTWVV